MDSPQKEGSFTVFNECSLHFVFPFQESLKKSHLVKKQWDFFRVEICKFFLNYHSLILVKDLPQTVFIVEVKT